CLKRHTRLAPRTLYTPVCPWPQPEITMCDDSTPHTALATRLISPATQRGKGRRPVNPPIERASTMLSDDPAQMTSSRDGPVYGLEGGSTARQLRSILADMEGAHDSLIVPSGLAAVTVPLTAILRTGDE